MLFVGAFERQLDDKGRLALPAIFRDRLRDHCYLAKGRDKCVTVVPSAVFENEAEAMALRVAAGEVPRDQLRALASSANMVQLDKQGRVTLDEHLRMYADVSVGSPVMVAGSFDRLEIWSPERFARENDAGTGGLAGDHAANE
ncbi:division/cell wall cluster transcriptional repressor MraZ [soil metagenome]